MGKLPIDTLLPKWIMGRYLILEEELKKKNTTEFDFDTAEAIMARYGDNKRLVGLLLSELRKAGWLKVDFDPKDARRRVYNLKLRDDLFNEFIKTTLKQRGR